MGQRGACGSSSDTHIFNSSKLQIIVEKGILGLPPPEPLGPGGARSTLLPAGGRRLDLMPWLVKPYSRRQLTKEERIASYRISRGRRVVENSLSIFVKRFRVLLTTMEHRPKVVRDIVLICVVLDNMLRSHQVGADRPHTQADDIQPPQAHKGKQGHNRNFRNPLKEGKHQLDLMKDYFNHVGVLAGQEDRV